MEKKLYTYMKIEWMKKPMQSWRCPEITVTWRVLKYDNWMFLHTYHVVGTCNFIFDYNLFTTIYSKCLVFYNPRQVLMTFSMSHRFRFSLGVACNYEINKSNTDQRRSRGFAISNKLIIIIISFFCSFFNSVRRLLKFDRIPFRL